MSVGLFKYDGNIKDHATELILSENVASERMYQKYFRPAITELNIHYFFDGAELRKKDLCYILNELQLLSEWIDKNIDMGSDKQYLNERINNLKIVIPRELIDDNDILYIF